MRPLLFFSVVVACLHASAFASNVLLVDSSGGGDFLEVQPAIDAASEGDTILLRRPPDDALRFGGFVIDGKSLSVISRRDGELLTGPVEIRGLRAGQSVVLSGLTLGKDYFAGPRPPFIGLVIQDCEGAVRVQDSELYGWSAPFAGRAGSAACAVTRSVDVVFRGCQMVGGRGAERLGQGGPGLVARFSSVLLYDSLVRGGTGAVEMASFSTNDAYGGPGGTGAVVVGATLYASASEIHGGGGGDAYYGDPSVGGVGGAGMRVGAAATAYSLDSLVAGGFGGSGDTQVGVNGPDVIGSLTLLAPDAERELRAPDRAEESAGVPLTLHGSPGETVVLLQSASAAARPLDPQVGFLHVGAPFRRTELGIVPASGALAFDFPAPDAPAAGALEVVLQAAFVAPGGGVRLSAPAHLFVFDGQAPPICGQRLHVDANAAPGGDGLSWATAFRDLNEALVLSADCPAHPTQVWVAQGTYLPAGPGGDRSRNFRLYSGTRLYGGFGGSETSLDQRDPVAHPVLLSGDLNGDDQPGFSGRDDNAYHVLRAGTRQFREHDLHVEGLTLRGGQGALGAPDTHGGGLLVYGTASVSRCTFIDNVANDGGGLYFDGDRLDVVDCRFVGNFAFGSGGGLLGTSREGGHVSVANSLFTGNAVEFFGSGGAVRVFFECSFELRNSLVYANNAPFGSAGIVGPTAFETTLSNCIVWGNTITYGNPPVIQVDIPVGTVDYSCIQHLDGSVSGVGNVDLDPGFLDPFGPDGVAGTLDDDLRLASGSPCVDAGRNADVPPDRLDQDGDGDTAEPLPFDLDGLARFVDDPLTVDTGEGTPPIVDMGPYER